MESVDRLPFWPKLSGAYPRAQKSPFSEMDINAIHDWIGSDKHVGITGFTRELRKSTAIETIADGDVSKTVYRTPHGETELVSRFDAMSQAWHPVSHPVKTIEDVRVMTEFFADVTVELDHDRLMKAREEAGRIGQTAITENVIGTSPLMRWVEWLAGIETAHCLLSDCRADVEALFDAMHAVMLRTTELVCENSPADILYLMENTSTTLISPDQFRRYCARHIGEYARVSQQAGRNMVLHMCGHLKALLPDLAEIPAQAFEAFTSPTLGNTTLLDGRTHCPDKCLIGGTNAMLWTRPSEEIIRQIEQDLGELPHHRGIVVTSAGVMPPLCEPETIRRVCEWVKWYPVRC